MTKDGLDLAIATQKARRELGELDVTITIDSFIELCEAARRTEERAPQELAWLIACKRGGALIGWFGLWDNEDFGWTLDPNKAIRFARQQDAEAVRSHWDWDASAEAGEVMTTEEHIWVGPILPMPLDSRRLDWLDQHCAFVADSEYNIGPFQVGELRQMADAGLAADWANSMARSDEGTSK